MKIHTNVLHFAIMYKVVQVYHHSKPQVRVSLVSSRPHSGGCWFYSTLLAAVLHSSWFEMIGDKVHRGRVIRWIISGIAALLTSCKWAALVGVGVRAKGWWQRQHSSRVAAGSRCALPCQHFRVKSKCNRTTVLKSGYWEVFFLAHW